MATPARSGDWLPTYRGATVINPSAVHPLVPGNGGALQGGAGSDDQGRSDDGRRQRAPRRQPEFNP